MAASGVLPLTDVQYVPFADATGSPPRRWSIAWMREAPVRIRSLEIVGFKSFADRATLEFDRGVSAIVGPNGCGKSNVVDAIRWVMGEQNPRNLRGRVMEDLVYAGTEKRAAVGMAEVTLRLDASEGAVPAAYAGFAEIEITRRLYRSGESEYLINRVPCRLRDVLDFFLDTGIGIRGYTIVQQGQIAGIVSTRPEERRFIFEEAAGIGKYRQRRQETERKLRSTEENLLRVGDILGELKRQINSLDRQAGRAHRYKELSGRVRDLELVVAREEFDAELARQRTAEREAENVRVEVVALDARVAREEAALEAGRRARLDREKVLGETSERLYALRTEIQSLESRVGYERRERESLLGLVKQREDETEQLREQMESNRSGLHEAVTRLAAAEARLERETSDVEAQEHLLRENDGKLADRQGRREALQSQLVQGSVEAASFRSRVETLEGRREELERRLRQLEEELEARTREVEGSQREEISLDALSRRALAEQNEHARLLAQALRAHAEAARRLEQAQTQLLAARDRVHQLSARLGSLRELEETKSLHVKKFLDRVPEAERRAIRGLLSDQLRVQEGLETAVEAVLSLRLDAVVAEDPESALLLLEWVRGADVGRTTVLCLSEEVPAPARGFVPVGRPLAEFVSASAPVDSLVRRLLRDVYLIEEGLSEVVRRYGLGEVPATFVTREGELLDRSGALTVGRGATPGALSRVREIRKLEDQLSEAEAVVSEAQRAAVGIAVASTERESEIENARSRRHTAELAVLQLEKDLERFRERGKDARESLEAHRRTKSGLEADIEASREERLAISGRLSELDRLLSQDEMERERLALEIAELARQLEQAEQAVVRRRIELAECGATRDQLRVGRDRTQQAIDETLGWISRRREEIRTGREQAEALQASAAEASQQLAELILREEVVRDEQQSLRDAFESDSADLGEVEERSRVARREQDELRERLSAGELAVAEARMLCDGLVARIREQSGVDLASFEPSPEQLAGDAEQRRAEVSQLRLTLRALGDVHLGAIEEYEEVSERYRYLREQKADLEVSVERLRNAIARINRTSRKRFRETFEAINKEFKKLFPELFDGGRARLTLTEAEDVLEAGIEIDAQPPGKRLQNVNLLSGGEKSLTAIALLFSVFRVKPSPFFLLDEVDAALDEANVERFNDLVTQTSSDSQFLLISHSRSTIARARTLYGITMQEPGLSKLVTVDLVA